MTPGYAHTQLHRRLVDSSSIRGVSSSTSRCRSRSHVRLGLRLNAKKSVHPPVKRTTYLGMVWDSTTMRPHNVTSGSLGLIQFHWMPCYRHGRGFVRTPFLSLYLRPGEVWYRSRLSGASVTVHGSVCSFCVRLCGWTRSLCLSALPSNRAPDQVIKTVTGVARLHCLYLAGVSVVRCQIVFTVVVSHSLCQSSRSGGCSRLVAFLYYLKAGDSALPGLLHCR